MELGDRVDDEKRGIIDNLDCVKVDIDDYPPGTHHGKQGGDEDCVGEDKVELKTIIEARRNFDEDNGLETHPR